MADNILGRWYLGTRVTLLIDNGDGPFVTASNTGEVGTGWFPLTAAELNVKTLDAKSIGAALAKHGWKNRTQQVRDFLAGK
jgi:hypothetical protein